MKIRLCRASVFLAATLAACSASTAGPTNYAPNSQWEIFSGEGFDARENVAGTGVMPAMAFVGNTTGANRVVLALSGPSGDLKVGDLVQLSGAGVDPTLTLAPTRVIALTHDATLTIIAPLNGIPTVSSAGLAQPVNVGMAAGSTHTGAAADHWSKTIGLEVWREDNAANLASGATYALGVNVNGLVADGRPPIYLGTRSLDAPMYRGRTVTFGVDVYQKVLGGSGTWRVYCASDGGVTTSPPAPASHRYDWSEVTCAVPIGATFLQVGVYFDGAPTDTYYVANPVLAMGSAIGPNNYEKPTEVLTPINGIVPLTWNNAVIRFPPRAVNSPNYFDILFDAYAETGGQIAPSVVSTDGQLEGLDGQPVRIGTGAVRAIGFRNSARAPIVVGGILAQYAPNVKSFTTMNITFDGSGHAWANSAVADDMWTNVSLEFDRFYLH